MKKFNDCNSANDGVMTEAGLGDYGSLSPETLCFVVGIGASAGGQEALEQIFTTMPTDCNLAFVVVMHLPPDGPSFLAEMLSRYTTMAVVTTEEGMFLQPNRIHMIPAGRYLTVSGGRLRLEQPETTHGAYHPIDHLFCSLAEEFGERTFAVVLSGSGSDGAHGSKLVKEAGGTVIVQDPESAMFPAMPRNAISIGTADLILTAEEISTKISDIARGVCVLPSRVCHVANIVEDLAAVCAIVKARTGHDFSSYKSNTVLRRIERRMAVNDAASIGKYLALLRDNDQEAHAVCQDILIGVTSFFRDTEAFATIRRNVIPRLFANRSDDEPVRIWHACCASGEEVYSMAILIREYLEEQKLNTRVLIFATDIDEVAIAQARSGLYGDELEETVGAERLKAFFTRSNGRWQVTKQLREMVIFAHHSLIKDPPFSRLDLLVCRNFLIYLNTDMQKRLSTLFHQALRPGGVLFLGSSETAGLSSELFKTIDKKWKIFERREGERRPDSHFPFTTSVSKLPETGRSTKLTSALVANPREIAEKLIIECYSLPYVVVNEKYEVVHVSTQMKRFLEVPPGEPTRDILKMAREELRPALRAAIFKVFAEQRKVDFKGMKFVDDGVEVMVNLTVEPLNVPQAAGKLAMIVFEQSAFPLSLSASSEVGAMSTDDEASKDMLVRQLEEQLRVTHEQLQATSGQLETSHEGFMSVNEELMSINEEFQSSNEELQSTNEELETSKEELQVLNEELATVNAELQNNMEELNQATSDMENLLASSGIATLFLDRQMNIKGFTPAVAAIFNLIRSDIGRTFRHFAGKIDWPSFTRDVETVLAGHPFAEREMTTLNNECCYLKRLLPYRTSEGRIDGIVVTFIDITERKQAEEALRESHQQSEFLANILQNSSQPFAVSYPDGRLGLFNDAFEQLTGYTGDELKTFDWVMTLTPPEWRDIENEKLEELNRTGRSVRYEKEYVRKDASRVPIELLVHLAIDLEGNARYYYSFVTDITERKLAEQDLREREERVRLKLDSILLPEGDIGNLELADIIDSQAIQSLMDDLYKLIHIPMAIIDLKGKVLVGKGWQDICTRFHRVHHETYRNCIESDLQLTEGIPPGEFKLYKCKNNMWDVATPIMVGGEHVGNLFSGQLFFDDEPLDYELFKSQAKRYGFDENEYINALERVPRLSRESLAISMEYFIKFAVLISKLSYSNIKLARSLTERDALMEAQHKSVMRLNLLAETASELLSNDSLHQVVDSLCQKVMSLLDCHAFFNFLVDEERGILHLNTCAGIPDEERLKIEWLDLGEDFSDCVARDACRIMAENIPETPDQLTELVKSYGIQAYACIPLRAHGRVLGTLSFGSSTRTCFSDDDLSLMNAVADQVAIAMERKQAEEALQRAHDELESRVKERTEELASTVDVLRDEAGERKRMEASLLRLNRLYAVLGETNQAIVRASDRDSLFRDFCRIAVDNGGFILSWVGLVDKESNELRRAAACGATGYLDDIRISVNEEQTGTGPTGISIREGAYYISNDFLNDPCTQPWHERGRAHGIKSSASVALKEEGRVIGAFSLYAGERDFFDSQLVELLVQMGADISFALDNMSREVRSQKAEQALQEETLERLRVVEALREKDKILIQQSRQAAMGEMINNIAHQWRQPLNGMALIVQSLPIIYETAGFNREYLETVQDKSMNLIMHMSQTIEDFRRFFRPDKEKMLFNVSEAVSKTLALIEDSFRDQRIAIEISAGDVSLINGYPNEYSQVLLNILNNARDALTESATGEPRVIITTRMENGKTVLTISDNAGGIPEQLFDRIFDPNFSTKGPDKGTGIGLYMSKMIIEQNMNGSLTVRNTDVGAEFRITV